MASRIKGITADDEHAVRNLTNLTKQALTLEELYGIDMNETLRSVQSGQGQRRDQ